MYKITDQPKHPENTIVQQIGLHYQMQATHHFFFGDENALELFNKLKGTAMQNDHEYFGVLECSTDIEPDLKRLKLLLDTVPHLPEQPGHNAILWMEDMHPNCWSAWQHAQFYLAGRRQLIQSFSEYLAGRHVTPLQMQLLALD